MIDARTCEHCGTPLRALSRLGGRPSRFCDKACRQKSHRASQRAQDTTQSADNGGRPGRRLEGGGTPVLGADPGVGQAPESVAGGFVSWYYAKFAAPAGQSHGPARRAARLGLRSLLRQVTTVDRCKRCGVDVIGSAAALVVKDNVAHWSGVETCGRIWLCPVCSAKIRARRGDEIAEAVGRHLEGGGGAYFATATLPHDQGDALIRSLEVLTQSWRSLMWGKAGKEDRERFGLVGNIKSVEITHGRKGWHPHIHAVILTEEPIGVLQLCEWFARLDARWSRALVRNGWAPGLHGRRFRLDLVNRSTAAGLAAYVTKVQDSAGLGNEIARADLKGAKSKTSRTPLGILADFGTDGLADDQDLWHEYEQATAGKSAIRWSRGLRALLLPDAEELTDEEIAAETVGGDTIAYATPWTLRRIAAVPGAEAAVFEAVGADGMEGLIRTLIAYRIGVDGVMSPEEWEDATPDLVLA